MLGSTQINLEKYECHNQIDGKKIDSPNNTAGILLKLQAREAIWTVFVTIQVRNERSHQIWCIGGDFRVMSVIDSRIFAY